MERLVGSVEYVVLSRSVDELPVLSGSCLHLQKALKMKKGWDSDLIRDSMRKLMAGKRVEMRFRFLKEAVLGYHLHWTFWPLQGGGRINCRENHERSSMLMTKATSYVSEVWTIETFKSELVAVRFTSWQ
jgi:hypothetical protein